MRSQTVVNGGAFNARTLWIALKYFLFGLGLTSVSFSSPINWLERDTRFYANLDREILTNGVEGVVSIEFQIFTDGTAFAAFKDIVNKNSNDDFYQRNRTVFVNDSSEWVFDLAKVIENRFCFYELSAGEPRIRSKPQFLVSCENRVTTVDVDALTEAELEQLSAFICKIVEEVFIKFDKGDGDSRLIVESDEAKPMKVDISNVLRDQGAFDGKRIEVEGYLLSGEGKALLYSEKKVERMKIGGYAPFMYIGDMPKQEQESIKPGEFRLVSVTGIFYRGFWDEKTQQAGKIGRVTEVQILDR